jgi:hypothetical protein
MSKRKPSKPTSNISPEEAKKHGEITPERLLEIGSITSLIIRQAEDDAKEQARRKEKKDAEIIELLGGDRITFGALSALVSPKRSPYKPLFPNTEDFWREIFRINGWHDQDPTQYAKPRIVGKWVCELIYDRYIKEVLPAVRQYNPMICNGFRLHKHFQFLTSEAKAMLIQYRDEAIALMRQCATWTEFRQKYLLKYGIGYQTSIFE